MTHAEFVNAYRDGEIRVEVDKRAAAQFVSRRLLLPLVVLPILGAGTALALSGWIWTGLAIIGLATLVPIVIKRSAPHFVLTQSVDDPRFYDDALRAGVLRITASVEC
jgi:hypothetical protein